MSKEEYVNVTTYITIIMHNNKNIWLYIEEDSGTLHELTNDVVSKASAHGAVDEDTSVPVF